MERTANGLHGFCTGAAWTDMDVPVPFCCFGLKISAALATRARKPL
jgi:hypothetical protein